MAVNVFGEISSTGGIGGLSNVLTIPKAAALFLNESGDSMNGDLDMQNNKIRNVGDPTDVDEAINKRYLDHALRGQIIAVEGMIEATKRETHTKIDQGTKVRKGNLPGDVVYTDAIKDFVTNTTMNERLSQKINPSRLPANLLYDHNVSGFTLNIGTSDIAYKESKFKIPGISLSPYLPYTFNFQITPYLDSREYHDEISMVVQHWEVTPSKDLVINVLTHRNDKGQAGWGLFVRAYLLVCMFYKPENVLHPI